MTLMMRININLTCLSGLSRELVARCVAQTEPVQAAEPVCVDLALSELTMTDWWSSPASSGEIFQNTWRTNSGTDTSHSNNKLECSKLSVKC